MISTIILLAYKIIKQSLRITTTEVPLDIFTAAPQGTDINDDLFIYKYKVKKT